MGLIVAGSVIAIFGWIYLLGGVGVSTGAAGPVVANLHAMVIATNAILGGYALIVAGLVRSNRPAEIIIPKTALPVEDEQPPTVELDDGADRTPVQQTRVAGIEGTLFSDGSIDVVQQSGRIRTFESADELRRFYRT